MELNWNLSKIAIFCKNPLKLKRFLKSFWGRPFFFFYLFLKRRAGKIVEIRIFPGKSVKNGGKYR